MLYKDLTIKLIFLCRTYIDTAHTALIGKPSLAMSKQLIQEENTRIEAQRAYLGKDGLQLLAAQLNHANRINEAQIPSRIMEGFPIPDVSSISSIEVLTAMNPYYQLDTILPNNLVQEHVSRDGPTSDIPFYIQYDRRSIYNYSLLFLLFLKYYIQIRYFLGICIYFSLHEYFQHALSSKALWSNVHGHYFCFTYLLGRK